MNETWFPENVADGAEVKRYFEACLVHRCEVIERTLHPMNSAYRASLIVAQGSAESEFRRLSQEASERGESYWATLKLCRTDRMPSGNLVGRYQRIADTSDPNYKGV